MGGGLIGCVGVPTHSSTSSLHLYPHPPHSPDTYFHTHPTPLPHTPPPPLTWHVSPHFATLISHLPHSLTLPHIPHIFSHTFLTSPHIHFTWHLPFTSPNTFLHSLPILSHTPHASSNTSPYFIIYPILKFLTFLIHCQISLTIKYTKNSL